MNRIQWLDAQLQRHRIDMLEVELAREQRRCEVWQELLKFWKGVATPEQLVAYRKFVIGD